MKKNTSIILLVSAVFVAGVTFLAYQSYTRIKTKGEALIVKAKELKPAFAANNIDLFKEKLGIVSKGYDEFEKEASSLYWLGFIPYVADFRRGVEAGNYMLRAAKDGVEAILPYADLIGFKKGQTSFVERSSQDRLQTAVLTLDKMLAKIDPISDDVKEAESRIEQIDANRYPEKIGNIVVRSKIENLKEQFQGLASLFVDAKPLLKKLPEIFGNEKEKTYLILFQNDKELRATGGFLTSYAIFKVKNGKIKIEKSDDIYALDNSIANHPDAPREIVTYHKDVSKFYLRDSNLSPDLPTSIELFNDLYKKSGGKVDYDGIVMLDSKILVDMLRIFGDTNAGGITFSAKTDKRCDCPQVLYTLFDIVDRPTPYLRENRKGILGTLMYELFYKAIGFSPSKYWGTLAQQMFTNMQEKHILLYFVDQDLQKSIEKLNYAGRIRETQKDYLHINNVNFAGAKANMFVSQSITSKTKTNDGGKTSREIVVDYRNPYPQSDCNLERGGLCLNAPLRNWIRVYVPKGSQLVNFQGSTKTVKTYDELGKTVFEGFLTVPTTGKAQAIITYTLPRQMSYSEYGLLVQKQAGTDDFKLKIDVDGKTLYNGILNTDKELKKL